MQDLISLFDLLQAFVHDDLYIILYDKHLIITEKNSIIIAYDQDLSGFKVVKSSNGEKLYLIV